MRSDVAQLRSCIAAEIEALNLALYGYAEVARHQIIENKYTQLGVYQVQLAELIGTTTALEVMTEELNEHVKDKPPLPFSRKH